MARLALTDLRRGTVILSSDPDQPAVPVLPQLPGSAAGGPYGVARLADGRLIFADRAASRVVCMAEDGSGFASFGTLGSGEGELRLPSGVAVGADGRIYVADTGNCRIVAVDSMAADGWQTYGSKGGPTASDPGIGRFSQPVALAADAGGVVVVDAGAARVVRLTTLSDAGWNASARGQLRAPVAVALLPDGTIVVADLAARRLALLTTPSAGVVAGIVDDLLPGPTAVVAVTNDRLAVCAAPAGALLSVERIGGVWSVTLDRWLGPLGLHRPAAMCLLP